MSAATQPTAVSASRLLAGYRPLPGVADELVDGAGNVRPVWQPFIEYLAKMTPEELARRVDQGDQYLRDAGVFFRQYGDESTKRAWPLSHLPVLTLETVWTTSSEGLLQRAELA